MDAPEFPEIQIATQAQIDSHRAATVKSEADQRGLFDRFFDAYIELGVQTAACAACEVTPRTIQKWRKKNLLGFADLYEQADQIINDRIRIEIRKRALVGSTTREVVETLDADGNLKSKRVRTLEYQTDTMLIFLGKSRMPEFRDRKELKVTIDVQTIDWLAQVLVNRIKSPELLKQIMEDIDAGMADVIDAEFEAKALPGE